MESLFDVNSANNAPLSERMRCFCLDDFLGQEHIVGPNSLLRRAIKADRLGSCIFYGPPGVGKTTLANVIAQTTNSFYVYLNAVSSGVGDAKKVIEDAKYNLSTTGKKTFLILDECHRWNKAQSDCVLSAIEKGEIIFIGSTTENPYVNMTKAIVSRCRIFEFRPLSDEDIVKGILNALHSPKGLGNFDVNLDDKALKALSFIANGDMRVALNALELAVLTTPSDNSGKINVTADIIEQSTQKPALSIDESQYYDILSAFCKSLRGSCVDSALYYAFRLIDAGCDPLLIARRLVAHSAEDVGLADPYALTMALNAVTALEKLGLPEGKIPLTECIIYVCKAPKSNSVIRAIGAVEEAVKTGHSNVPRHLCDTSYKPDKNVGYKYPHDYGGYVEQQYLPDDIRNEVFYQPSDIGDEINYKHIWRSDYERIKRN